MLTSTPITLSNNVNIVVSADINLDVAGHVTTINVNVVARVAVDKDANVDVLFGTLSLSWS